MIDYNNIGKSTQEKFRQYSNQSKSQNSKIKNNHKKTADKYISEHMSSHSSYEEKLSIENIQNSSKISKIQLPDSTMVSHKNSTDLLFLNSNQNHHQQQQRSLYEPINLAEYNYTENQENSASKNSQRRSQLASKDSKRLSQHSPYKTKQFRDFYDDENEARDRVRRSVEQSMRKKVDKIFGSGGGKTESQYEDQRGKNWAQRANDQYERSKRDSAKQNQPYIKV